MKTMIIDGYEYLKNKNFIQQTNPFLGYLNNFLNVSNLHIVYHHFQKHFFFTFYVKCSFTSNTHS